MHLAVEMFNSCGEIESYVREVRAEYEDAFSSTDRTPLAMEIQGASEDNSSLNIQEGSVDEPDRLRVGSKQIYFSHGNRITVMNRATLGIVGNLELGSWKKIEMFTDGDKLIALGKVIEDYSERVLVRSYAIRSATELPSLTSERGIAGKYVDARLFNGRVILLTSGYISEGGIGDSVAGVDCSRVSVPLIRDLDFSYSRISSLSTSDLNASPSELGLMGLADLLYVTSDSIYVVKNNSWWPGARDSMSALAKVTGLSDGNLLLRAVGVVKGQVKDRWALKEFSAQKAIAIASTYNEEGNRNQLAVLQENGEKLEEKAKVSNFGKNEDIRAVRYVGDMAYVVTFEKTDPLFAINLHDPMNPTLQGELEVPGFSTYLHPVQGQRLMGLGFDATDMGSFSWFQGVKVALYDVHDPFHLAQIASNTLGSRGSYSEATANPHAFYFDEHRQEAGFPIVEVSGGDGLGGYGQQIEFSGAVLYSAGSLSLKGRLTHANWIPEDCKKTMAIPHWWQASGTSFDISRLAKVDGRLLSFSEFGWKQHSVDSPSNVVAELAFISTMDTHKECPQGNPYLY